MKKNIYVIFILFLFTIKQKIYPQQENPFGESISTFADKQAEKNYKTNVGRYQKLSELAKQVDNTLDAYKKNNTPENKNMYDKAVHVEQAAQQKYAEQSKQNLKEQKLEKPLMATATGTITCKEKIVPIMPGSIFQNQDFSGCTFDGTLKNIAFNNSTLNGAKFNMLFFENVQFNNSNLTGATFSGSTFANSAFHNTRLFFSNFIFVTAQNLLFDQARIQGANMSGSTFAKTKFINECNIEQVDFTESQFDDVYVDQESSVAHASFVNIRGSSLSFGTPYCTVPQPTLPPTPVSFMGFAGLEMSISFESATYFKPNLHMTNFNEAKIDALCFLGNRTNPLNLIGVSSENALTQKVSFNTLYYDAPAIKLNKPLICECPAGEFMHNFMQAAKTGKCGKCEKVN